MVKVNTGGSASISSKLLGLLVPIPTLPVSLAIVSLVVSTLEPTPILNKLFAPSYLIDAPLAGLAVEPSCSNILESAPAKAVFIFYVATAVFYTVRPSVTAVPVTSIPVEVVASFALPL